MIQHILVGKLPFAEEVVEKLQGMNYRVLDELTGLINPDLDLRRDMIADILGIDRVDFLQILLGLRAKHPGAVCDKNAAYQPRMRVQSAGTSPTPA